MGKRLLILFLLFFVLQSGFSQEISIGKRDKVYSEILRQDREFSVYFPPSYNIAVNQKYPVLYILDGDWERFYSRNRKYFPAEFRKSIVS